MIINKKIKSLFSFLFLICIFCLVFLGLSNKYKNDTYSNLNIKYTITEPYKYPVIPGTKEWNLLNDHQEMIDACYIEPEFLSKMTTEALVETVITYPLFVDAFAYDTFDVGLQKISRYFAGIDELLSREDAYEVLEKFYNNSDLLVEGNYKTYISCLLRYIDNSFDNFRGLTYLPDTVLTPNNTAVAVYVGCDWDDWGYSQSDVISIQTINNAYVTTYNASMLNSIDPSYNCHSYAWYQQSNNNKWMNDPSAYTSDGSYSASYPVNGRKITYNTVSNKTTSLEHSGIISLAGATIDSMYVTSKWGCGALFYHKAKKCPYYSDGVYNYTSFSYWKLN